VGLYLAEIGADVIKVEAPGGGDLSRTSIAMSCCGRSVAAGTRSTGCAGRA
jgi:crotonobetainyl-CoA:carnitine CoA-transferase CaiB-like acyl-CoA transferase